MPRSGRRCAQRAMCLAARARLPLRRRRGSPRGRLASIMPRSLSASIGGLAAQGGSACRAGGRGRDAGAPRGKGWPGVAPRPQIAYARRRSGPVARSCERFVVGERRNSSEIAVGREPRDVGCMRLAARWQPQGIGQGAVVSAQRICDSIKYVLRGSSCWSAMSAHPAWRAAEQTSQKVTARLAPPLAGMHRAGAAKRWSECFRLRASGVAGCRTFTYTCALRLQAQSARICYAWPCAHNPCKPLRK